MVDQKFVSAPIGSKQFRPLCKSEGLRAVKSLDEVPIRGVGGRARDVNPRTRGNDGLEPVLAWMASVVAVGLLGAGVYAVFYSTNGPGAVALLSIGSLALFIIAFRDRIRSMEFGGARVQLAFKVRDSLKMAFKLRLAGNYEGAENEVEFAFSQFVRAPKVQRAYKDSMLYRERVLKLLGKYVDEKFGGEVRETASTASFFPLVDAVMKIDGPRTIEIIKANGGFMCAELEERATDDGFLRTAIIVRPGPDLDTEELAERLDWEVRRGALGIDCFLLVQNCKDSDSRKEFCDLVNDRNDLVDGGKMHAKSAVWELKSSPELLTSAFLSAILTMCDSRYCGFSHAEIRPKLDQPSKQS